MKLLGDQIVTQKSKVQEMTQAQRHFKNSFTKTYDKWSDHFFYKSLEVISC